MRLLFVLLLCVCASASATEQTISHGRFEHLRLHLPAGTVEQFVLLLADSAASGDQLADTLAKRGALVASIDTHAFFAKLEADGSDCVSPDGDLENLSHYLQALNKLQTYHAPILIGDKTGAAFVFAMLAQAPPETFAGGISLRFCPELALRKRLCKDHQLDYSVSRNGGTTLLPAKLNTTWLVTDADAKCAAQPQAFVEHVTGSALATTSASRDAQLTRAYVRLASTIKPVLSRPPEQVADLPLIEVPSQIAGDTLAILFSGDGGWAGIDKEVAGAIARSGIPVVGVDSLRYFWSERTPNSLARDLERIVATYTRRWQRQRVLLIGYSQGADVLPFAVNRIDAPTRASIANLVLIGLAERAQFEFHVGNWLGMDEEQGLPTAPEVHRIRSTPVMCIYGEDDEDATCNDYVGTRVRVVKLPGGHHFDGEYERLARVISGKAEERDEVTR